MEVRCHTEVRCIDGVALAIRGLALVYTCGRRRCCCWRVHLHHVFLSTHRSRPGGEETQHINRQSQFSIRTSYVTIVYALSRRCVSLPAPLSRPQGSMRRCPTFLERRAHREEKVVMVTKPLHQETYTGSCEPRVCHQRLKRGGARFGSTRATLELNPFPSASLSVCVAVCRRSLVIKLFSPLSRAICAYGSAPMTMMLNDRATSDKLDAKRLASVLLQHSITPVPDVRRGA